jgi:hypothetical protein
MSFTRAFRKGLCRLLVGALVFAQLSIAAHACPAMAFPQGEDSASAAIASAIWDEPDADAARHGHHASQADTDQAGVPCGDADMALSGLCAEHCQQGQQAVDGGQAPSWPAALPACLYPVPSALAADAIEPAPWRIPSSAVEAVAASPPHAILHCCFRI